MSVITISREFGSGGSIIAEHVAQTLGYHFVDKKTIAKILSQYGFVEFIDEYDTVMGFWDRFDSRKTEMVTMLNRIILALAHHNNMVILGRGSFAVLEGYADVLNVKIQAPLSARIQRVMENQHIADQETAETIVKENDQMRATFIESFYGDQWNIAKAFNLVIDTAKISPEMTGQWIIEAVKAIDTQKAGNQQVTANIQVDPVLKKTIVDMFEHQIAL